MPSVFEARDVASIYEIPLALHEQGLDERLCARLALQTAPPRLTDWREMVRRITAPGGGSVRIAVVGKYCGLPDAYKSVKEALVHGGAAHDVQLTLDWVDAEALESYADEEMARWAESLDGILVPGGFGLRGVEGKIRAIRLAREHRIPFLGICLGLQAAVIEFARNAAAMPTAHSAEFREDVSGSIVEVVSLLDHQSAVTRMGGTMRLGAYPAALAAGSLVARLYRTQGVTERHRHRYEVNPQHRSALEAAGLTISGTSPDGALVEFIELPDTVHPYFVATQAHPEFKSQPTASHPLFAGLVGAAACRRAGRQRD
jgi:CTP synthase